MELFVDDSHSQAKTYKGKGHGYQNPFYGLKLLLAHIFWTIQWKATHNDSIRSKHNHIVRVSKDALQRYI